VVLFWLGLGLMCSVPLAVFAWLLVVSLHVRRRYLHVVVRIFQEKPLFVAPRGQPWPAAQDVRFPTSDGLTLVGCYLRTARPRRGVILFAVEYGADRWTCRPHCEHLVEAGFDVFAYEPRNQGASDRQGGYEPLQWVTDHEVRDAEAALAYLKGRGDADPRGVGFFGVSRGAGAGLIAAARDGYVRCCASDGAFGTYSTLVPYMRHWFRIYSPRHGLQSLLPTWYYGMFGLIALRRIERERRCRFPHLERVLRRWDRLQPARPLLFIHGGADTYIKPEMARLLFVQAAGPKEFWLVEGAKHNQAVRVAGAEYHRRVLSFFEEHLAQGSGVGGQQSGVRGQQSQASLV
jgi:pimeloyl-ACP methyl ester carboxylesterase